MFSSAQRKLNLAFFNAVFIVSLELKLFSSANFWIRSISSFVVDRDTNCERILGTSVFDLNLKIPIKDNNFLIFVDEVVWIMSDIFTTQEIKLTFLQFLHVCSSQNLAPTGDFVDVSMLRPKPHVYLAIGFRWKEWDPSISEAKEERKVNKIISFNRICCGGFIRLHCTHFHQMRLLCTTQSIYDCLLFSGQICRLEFVPQKVPLFIRSMLKSRTIHQWNQVNGNAEKSNFQIYQPFGCWELQTETFDFLRVISS